MKNRKKRNLLCCFILFVLVIVLSACGKQASHDETKTAESETALQQTSASQTETEETITCIDDMKKVINAIENVSNQPSFGINTKATLKLKGNIIKGTYHFRSEVHVSQKEDHENLLMSSKSTSDMDDIVTTAYYKDGWYYTNGENGREKEEKSADEVFELISTVTDLVKDAAQKVEKVSIKNNGDDLVYTYELPSYLAQRYLKTLVDSSKTEKLSGASVKIEKAVLVSVIDKNGMLKAQKVKIKGSIHKLIITVPATAEVTARFQTPDTESPKIKTW